MKKFISASVRHAEAVMDQMTVTQLIDCYRLAWRTAWPRMIQAIRTLFLAEFILPERLSFFVIGIER
jgi:hypothetical protein